MHDDSGHAFLLVDRQINIDCGRCEPCFCFLREVSEAGLDDGPSPLLGVVVRTQHVESSRETRAVCGHEAVCFWKRAGLERPSDFEHADPRPEIVGDTHPKMVDALTKLQVRDTEPAHCGASLPTVLEWTGQLDGSAGGLCTVRVYR